MTNADTPKGFVVLGQVRGVQVEFDHSVEGRPSLVVSEITIGMALRGGTGEVMHSVALGRVLNEW